MNLTKHVWADAMMMVIVLMTLCACVGGKRRHGNRYKSTPAPLTEVSDTDSDVTTLIPHTNATIKSNGKQNEYEMWTIDKYPNPRKQPKKCGHSRQPSFLCDPDRILSPTEGNELYVCFCLAVQALFLRVIWY